MLLFYAFSFMLFGLVIGSFLNVVIYRLPRHESIVMGRSHCPHCGHTLSALDLFPVFSYLWLRGQCRYCHQSISLRYPFIEFLTGMSYLFAYLHYGFSLQTLLALVLSSLYIVISLIDWDTLEIYDRFHILLLVIALIYIPFSGLSLYSHLLGFVIISVPFLLLSYFNLGMGGGDVKLMAVSGLMLGFSNTIVAFFIASITGGIYGLYLLWIKKQDRHSQLPFGPFLCLGLYSAYLWGPQLIRYYLNLFS